MQTVHVRINDAATGKPTPCRVRFTDAAGKYYAPLGRLSDFPRGLTHGAEGNVYDGDDKWAYIDGACEIQLPPGPITVQARKGFEYTPLNTTVELVPGKLALRFTLERWIDMRQKGWYSGDGRVHNLTPHEALLQAAGEDLAVVNLLIEENAGSIPNITAFSGQQPCLEMPGHIVAVNTRNIHLEQGSLNLLYCHRIVYPLRVEPEDKDQWTLADWCDQCHRKGGLVVWAENDRLDPLIRSEAVADVVLGKIDAYEISYLRPECHERSFSYAGFHLPMIGSSNSNSNRPIGQTRTYCQLLPGETLTYRNWIEAVRAGRTFVTCGPIIHFTVNGQTPGSTVELAKTEKSVTIEIDVTSPMPFDYICLVGIDTDIRVNPETNEFPWRACLKMDVPISHADFFDVRCMSSHGGLPHRELAHSGTVYVNGPPWPDRALWLEHLDNSLLAYIDAAEKRCPRNERLLHVLHAAQAELAKRLAAHAAG